jgi:hypothetical protein
MPGRGPWSRAVLHATALQHPALPRGAQEQTAPVQSTRRGQRLRLARVMYVYRTGGIGCVEFAGSCTTTWPGLPALA